MEIKWIEGTNMVQIGNKVYAFPMRHEILFRELETKLKEKLEELELYNYWEVEDNKTIVVVSRHKNFDKFLFEICRQLKCGIEFKKDLENPIPNKLVVAPIVFPILLFCEKFIFPNIIFDKNEDKSKTIDLMATDYDFYEKFISKQFWVGRNKNKFIEIKGKDLVKYLKKVI